MSKDSGSELDAMGWKLADELNSRSGIARLVRNHQDLPVGDWSDAVEKDTTSAVKPTAARGRSDAVASKLRTVFEMGTCNPCHVSCFRSGAVTGAHVVNVVLSGPVNGG